MVLVIGHSHLTSFLVIADSITYNVGSNVLFSLEDVSVLASHERLPISEQHGVNLRLSAVGLHWGLNCTFIVVETPLLLAELTCGSVHFHFHVGCNLSVVELGDTDCREGSSSGVVLRG